jgi:hypothetical protein
MHPSIADSSTVLRCLAPPRGALALKLWTISLGAIGGLGEAPARANVCAMS